MPQQGSFSTWDVVITSPMRSSAFIGSACRSELYSRWRRWRIVLCMVLHHLTWRRHSLCRWHAAPTQAQVRLHWTGWRSDLSSVNCRRSCLPVAGAKVWNGLPSDVTSALSLSVFKNRLKTYLFRRCYETVWLWITFLFPSHYLSSRTVVPAIVFTV